MHDVEKRATPRSAADTFMRRMLVFLWLRCTESSIKVGSMSMFQAMSGEGDMRYAYHLLDRTWHSLVRMGWFSQLPR